MCARICVWCDKLTDDPICSHCGRMTDIVNTDDNEADFTDDIEQVKRLPKVYVGDGEWR